MGKTKLTAAIVRDTIMPAIAEGESYASIGRKVGITGSQIARIGGGQAWVEVTGGELRPNRVYKIAAALHTVVLPMLRAGHTRVDIAKKLGVCRNSICYQTSQHARDLMQRRLTRSEVMDRIIPALERGIPQQKIADALFVARSTIQSIAVGRTWSPLTGRIHKK